MTQEQKDLLLKDLCARLPYGVKVQVAPVPSKEYEHITYNAKIVYIDNNYIGVLSDWNSVFQQDITKVKPYLFPLSSMTEEYINMIPRKNQTNLRFTNAIKQGDISSITSDFNLFEIRDIFDWLLKNHFDIYGLIPKGLANDATGLNIY